MPSAPGRGRFSCRDERTIVKPFQITNANREQEFADSLNGLPEHTLRALLRTAEAKLRRPMYPQQAARAQARRDAIQAAITRLAA